MRISALARSRISILSSLALGRMFNFLIRSETVRGSMLTKPASSLPQTKLRSKALLRFSSLIIEFDMREMRCHVYADRVLGAGNV